MKILLLTICFISSNLLAQVPHSFISGQKIKASELNDNFLALMGGGSGSSEAKEYNLSYQSSFETQINYFNDNFLNQDLYVGLFYQDAAVKAMRADFRRAPETPSETTKETCLSAGFVWRVLYNSNSGTKSETCTFHVYAGYFYDSTSPSETILSDIGKQSIVRLMSACSAENYSSQAKVLGYLWFKDNIRAQRPISECDFD